jgi:hypothetical protein
LPIDAIWYDRSFAKTELCPALFRDADNISEEFWIQHFYEHKGNPEYEIPVKEVYSLSVMDLQDNRLVFEETRKKGVIGRKILYYDIRLVFVLTEKFHGLKGIGKRAQDIIIPLCSKKKEFYITFPVIPRSGVAAAYYFYRVFAGKPPVHLTGPYCPPTPHPGVVDVIINEMEDIHVRRLFFIEELTVFLFSLQESHAVRTERR